MANDCSSVRSFQTYVDPRLFGSDLQASLSSFSELYTFLALVKTIGAFKYLVLFDL